MLRIVLPLMCLVALLATVPASAQEAAFGEFVPAIEKGKSQLAAAANATFMEDANAWMVLTTYGKYVTDTDLAGLTVGLFGGSDMDTSGIAGVAYQHLFINKEQPKRTVPFVGAGVLGFWAEGESEAGWQAGGGVKIFVKPEVDWAVGANIMGVESETLGQLSVALEVLFD